MNKIAVLGLRVNEPLKVEVIENELKALQDYVGGIIEIVRIREDIGFICDGNGKIFEKQPNFLLNRFRDAIVGDVLFVALTEDGDTVSLTQEQKNFVENFLRDETIRMIKGRVLR